MGPTYAKIIASQFARLRRGDRFFYEDNTDPNVSFTLAELNEIRKATFAKIMCNNLSRQSKPLCKNQIFNFCEICYSAGIFYFGEI